MLLVNALMPNCNALMLLDEQRKNAANRNLIVNALFTECISYFYLHSMHNLASARLIRKGCTFGASFVKLGTRKNNFGLVSTGTYCLTIEKFIFLEYIRTGDS